MATLELHNINKSFGQGSARVDVLKNIDFSAKKGEVILILGPSGSGKSTFLTILGNLQTPSSGQVKINGQDIGQLSDKQKESIRLNQIGFILQSYNLVPFLTVAEQFKLVQKVKKEDNLTDAQLNDVLDILDIKQLKNKYPGQLSGGQNQRVAIARALYTNPEIILADEPTAALDSQRVAEVGKLLKKLAVKQDKAIIIVTHDLRLQEFADKTYHLDDGKLTLALKQA